MGKTFLSSIKAKTFWNQLYYLLKKRRSSDIGTKIRPISRIDDPSIVDIAASTDIPSEEFFTTLKVIPKTEKIFVSVYEWNCVFRKKNKL